MGLGGSGSFKSHGGSMAEALNQSLKSPEGSSALQIQGKDLRTKNCQVYKRQNVFDSFCVCAPSAEAPSAVSHST